MKFKESFFESKSHRCHYKLASWKLGGELSNCCSWNGVECDKETGHVIGLDLSSSCLSGFLSSRSSLFRLVHLRRLSLANNNFNYSEIPSELGSLSELTHLNLSASFFSGQIPSGISKLLKLSSLDLSMNSHPYFGTNLLELERPVLVSLAQNLTRLEKLHLSRVNISSLLPENLANLSSLTSLDMKGCRLYGQFPIKMFQLPKLEYLNLRYNPFLVGHLPEFQSGSPLRAMLLTGSSFSGSLPVSIGDLASLTELDINGCNLSGFLPYSLSKLTKLLYLDISNNNFKGHIPSLGNLTKLTHSAISSSGLSGGSLSWITKLTKLTLLTLTDSNLGGKIPFFLGNLTQLETLHLRNNNFSGQIPTQLMNLKKLTTLDLFSNHLTGPVPAQLKNLTRLTRLDLASNKFNGQLPTSIFDLKTLVYLDVSSNGFNGTVEFDSFLKMKNLVCLFLSNNYLSLVVGSSTTVTTQKFRELGLASCNLSTFPYFLQNLEKLEWLDLSYNNIRGQIPKWMATAGKETLKLLDLSHNFLTCFDQHTVELPWSHLAILNLMSNRLQGLLPVPPPSIFYYTISNNSLIGEIPPLICNSSSLQILDLSYNNLSGKVPECLCNFSDSLVITLRCNQLEGTIP